MSEGNKYGVPRKPPGQEDGISITLKRYELPIDPDVHVFLVVIESNEGKWTETLPTEEGLRLFLKGMQAGAFMYGNKHAAVPEIPVNAEQFPTE